MHNKRNFISAIICQIITMISGLILPRLIIATFGSEINGLVSSITQFLGFIAVLEGGLGAVVLSELYKPIECRDDSTIKGILSECQNFFSKLSIIFVGYTFLLILIFPWITKSDNSFFYNGSLILILSFTTIIRYLFSITNRLYLQANQKVYIVNNVTSILTVVNLVVAYLVICIYPEIHLLKIMADIAFLIQPIMFKHYVEKRFRVKISLKKRDDHYLKNRWSGFSQNLAHYINMNTDIVIITLFLGFKAVSVYTVYMLAINALRSLVSLLSNSYQSALGKYYAQGDTDNLFNHYSKFDTLNLQISVIAFNTCLLLINPFVSLYTDGINDANYYQPIFASIIVFANMLYSIREPKRYMILSAGKFKETNFGAIMEAVINISLSLLLVYHFGLIGIAIGTLVAITYRHIYFINYLNKDLLLISFKHYLAPTVIALIICASNYYIYHLDLIVIDSVSEFLINGFLLVLVESIITFILFKIMLITQKALSNRRDK